jgi:hypothetical protein
MADVTAWCLNETLNRFGAAEVTRAFAGWWEHASAGNAEHSHRPVSARVATLGEDTAQVLSELAIPC